jgi:putative ATP-dependent endonuclease of the OLD family
MKVRHLTIRNFRGIKDLEWRLPDAPLFCLIGRGDSTKSTILEAIRIALYPHWNLVLDHSDFYLCKAEEFLIEVTIGQLPDELLDLTRYGQYLRGWNVASRELQDEPGDGLEDVLTILLRVDQSLEPKWLVTNNRIEEDIEFRTGDRARVGVGYIGDYPDRHLTWSKGSVLSKLTQTQNINSSLAGAARAAKDALDGRRETDLIEFDSAASKAETAARDLGVQVTDTYKAHLDVGAVNVKLGGLALHDGDVPLRRLGLGSRRMLICALQTQALKQPHVTLFDEVEIGLEPSRIARMLKSIQDDTSGQYVLTTHSPVVLRELTVSDLYVVHSDDGIVKVISANQPGIADSVQGHIRLAADAFLSTKVVVCEGATEVGLCRGLDHHWLTQGKATFAYQGVACLDAAGARKIKDLASNIKTLGYDVAVLADSDAPDQFSQEDANALRQEGVEVICWDGGVSVEERILSDIPWAYVLESVACARTIHGDSVTDHINSQYGSGFERNPDGWSEDPVLRSAIAKAAKHGDWFKRQSWAEKWIEVIESVLDLPDSANTDFVKKIDTLRSWVDRD